jgi:hypothetical protein
MGGNGGRSFVIDLLRGKAFHIHRHAYGNFNVVPIQMRCRNAARQGIPLQRRGPGQDRHGLQDPQRL